MNNDESENWPWAPVTTKEFCSVLPGIKFNLNMKFFIEELIDWKTTADKKSDEILDKLTPTPKEMVSVCTQTENIDESNGCSSSRIDITEHAVDCSSFCSSFTAVTPSGHIKNDFAFPRVSTFLETTMEAAPVGTGITNSPSRSHDLSEMAYVIKGLKKKISPDLVKNFLCEKKFPAVTLSLLGVENP